jgi:hypothetical protein
MKNLKFHVFILFAFFISCQPVKDIFRKPTPPEAYPEVTYLHNQGIGVFENPPTDSFRNEFLQFISPGSNFDALEIRECPACDTYMELWELDSIGTDIHRRTLSAGYDAELELAGRDNKGMAFVNIISTIPKPTNSSKVLSRSDTVRTTSPNPAPENTIVIAVIDTGIDLLDAFEGSSQIWKNPFLNQSSPDCPYRGENGWNFVSDTSYIQDDHFDNGSPAYHGTKVSQLIVDQFGGDAINKVEIMTLKTHGENGSGDLFSNICAIHYAMDHEANIINASWGVYFDKRPFKDSNLEKLITKKLTEKGILFVTSAGNQLAHVRPKDPEINARDLNQFNFIPAVFGERDNNILVATTVFRGKVSDGENFSHKYVDFGIHADYSDFSFNPYRGADSSKRIYGSSYATAVLTGRIGASASLDLFQTGITKQDIIPLLNPNHSFCLWYRGKVRKGRFIRPINQ